MKAILCKHYGVNEDNVYLSDISEMPCGQNEVRVKVLFSPINPSDINMIEGKYYVQPDLPHVLGREGVGEVIEVGSDVTSVTVGDVVISPFSEGRHWHGFWCETFVVQAEDVIVLPESIELAQAAMINTNPLTAYQMIRAHMDIDSGGWIVQNAANSGVGRCVIGIAAQFGLKTLNFVRRKDVGEELKALGADEVVVIEEGSSKSELVRSVLKGATVQLGLNAVGGWQASEVAKCLGQDGNLVTYGAMAKEPVTVSNGQLIYKGLTCTGFNRTKWLRHADRSEVLDCYQHIIDWVDQGVIAVPVDRCFSMDEYYSAIQYAVGSERQGKVLFDFR